MAKGSGVKGSRGCYVCGAGRECGHGAPIPRPTIGEHYNERKGRWERGFTMPPRMLTDAEAARVVPLKAGWRGNE